jgi:hypothetical protein
MLFIGIAGRLYKGAPEADKTPEEGPIADHQMTASPRWSANKGTIRMINPDLGDFQYIDTLMEPCLSGAYFIRVFQWHSSSRPHLRSLPACRVRVLRADEAV